MYYVQSKLADIYILPARYLQLCEENNSQHAGWLYEQLYTSSVVQQFQHDRHNLPIIDTMKPFVYTVTYPTTNTPTNSLHWREVLIADNLKHATTWHPIRSLWPEFPQAHGIRRFSTYFYKTAIAFTTAWMIGLAWALLHKHQVAPYNFTIYRWCFSILYYIGRQLHAKEFISRDTELFPCNIITNVSSYKLYCKLLIKVEAMRTHSNTIYTAYIR